jgi:hypothetical protein
VNTEGEGEPPSQPPQVALARRLNLLLDAVVAERGTPVTFREVQEKLAERGIGMSRARWFYMKDGSGRLVTDKRVLTGICEMFGVDPTYLLDAESPELPESIQARLELVKSLRVARVRAFAARTLGDVAPETLRAISEYLNRDLGSAQQDESATDPSDNEGERPEES